MKLFVNTENLGEIDEQDIAEDDDLTEYDAERILALAVGQGYTDWPGRKWRRVQ
ncbi:hypothetical protein [Xanthomonas phage Suba]|uniref:Uncharacterized protein n=1 Tax=Xanthomonas phage Suba TaxID=2674975 RepID=A0A679KGN4_9CAUD|nr:hypothetical protein QAY88_gp51 [Xanthomonas phage Suba]CAA2409879.1 hypothetical protein [Xanthomonas phage Suba]